MGMLSPRAPLIPMVVIAATAHAVDRGQFENVPDDIRRWFKGVTDSDRRSLLRHL